MELTKTFSADQFSRGLQAWRWLDLGGKTPVFASLFGDVVLESSAGLWFLDTLEGSLAQVWDSRDALRADLSTAEGQDKYLLAGLAHEAHRRGIVLASDEVYDFVPPPAVGGSLDLGNITTTDFVVSLDIAGQIHEQIKDLPPGTRITGITFEE